MKSSDVDLQLDYMRRLKQQRIAKRRPESMVFVLGRGDLTTLAVQNVVAASFVRRYPGARPLALLRDTPEAGPLVDCNPYLRYELRMEGEITGLLDWFDIGAAAPVKCPDPSWQENKHGFADIVFLPHMLSVAPSRLQGFAEAPGYLSLPPAKQAALWPALEQAGLKSGGWFAVIQAGGDGAEAQVEPASYLPAIEMLLESGGQVVRLGGPDESSLPARPGLIDLRGTVLPLQLAAIAAARLVVGGDGAVVTLASAFAVPCALTNAVSYAHRVWAPDAVVLAKAVELADGGRLDTATAYARGFLDGAGDAAVVARHDNRPEEIRAVTQALLDQTAGCSGWRASRSVEAGPAAPAGVPFPLQLDVPPPLRWW